MFGKKHESKKEELPDVKVIKIPDDFYAGNNPIIKFNDIEKVIKPPKVDKNVLSVADKKLLDQKTAAGAGNKLHPANLFTSWKFLLFIAIGILVVGGGLAGFYFWWQARQVVVAEPAPPQPIVAAPVVSEPVVETPIVVEPEPEVIFATTTAEIKLEIPSLLLGDSADSDKDDITDMAEELFKTDPAVPDSDNDKFADGHEVFYLYNPNGKEPLKLIDSGLVSTYTNPAFSYKLYYPNTWAVGNVDLSFKNVLFSTLTGENIEVRVMDLNSGETFNDWFAKNATGEQLTDYLPTASVFGETGLARKDNLVFFFPKGDKIFVIVYHTTDSVVVNHRIIIKMMARSFQFGNSSEVESRPTEENIVPVENKL